MSGPKNIKELVDRTLGMEDNEFSMLASWGKPGDDAIRQKGTAIQSPVVPLDSKLNFEQRILKPNSYPAIDNGDGTESTHRMAWGEVDGKYIAYPTIVQAPDKSLVQLSDEGAFQHAMKSGEYREFSKPEDASAYAEGGYKKFWGLGEKKQ